MSTQKKTQLLNNDVLVSKSNQDSNFRAVKSLVQAQNSIEMVRNRIKVLQLNESKNMNKINVQKEQIQKITMVRNQHLQQLRKMGINKLDRERMAEEIKSRNQLIRKQHQQKMAIIKQETQEEKARGYSNTLQLRQLHESRILQNTVNSLHQRQQKRNMVVQSEEKSRQNVIKFNDDKTKSIYQKSLSEIKLINKSRQKKQKQLGQFSNIQMQMILRHSQSQVAYKQMKSKLDTMLGRIRTQKRKDLKQMKSSVNRNGKQNTTYSLDGV